MPQWKNESPLNQTVLFSLMMAFLGGLLILKGCGDSVDKKILSDDTLTLSGKLKLDQLNISSDLLFGINGNFQTVNKKIQGKIISDFSVFQAQVNNTIIQLRKDGSFIFEGLPGSQQILIRIGLIRNPNLEFQYLLESSTPIKGEKSIEVGVESTAIAALLKRGRDLNRRISPSDLSFVQTRSIIDSITDQIENQPQNFKTPGLPLDKISQVVSDLDNIVLQFDTDGGDLNKTDFSGPVIFSLNHQTFFNSATIRWFTDEESTTQIRYGTASSVFTISTPFIDDFTTEHSVVLTDLAPDVFYFYTAVSIDRSGNSTVSEIKKFVIPSNGASFFAGSVFNGNYFDFSKNITAGGASDGDVLFTLLGGSPTKVRLNAGSGKNWKIQVNPRLIFSSSEKTESREKSGWGIQAEVGVAQTFAFFDQENKSGLARITETFGNQIQLEYFFPMASQTLTVSTGTFTLTNPITGIGTSSYDFSAGSFVNTPSGNLNLSALLNPPIPPYFKANFNSQFKIYQVPGTLPVAVAGKSSLPSSTIIDSALLKAQDQTLLTDTLYQFEDDQGRFGIFRVVSQQPFNGASGTGLITIDWSYQPAFLEGSTTAGFHILE